MTLFASFATRDDAERAAAALMDRGARSEDLSIVAQQPDGNAVAIGRGDSDPEDVAKRGVTTTTAADAAFGAAKGITIGTGIGFLGALAALMIPGVGLVVGAGALATAIGAAAATGAAAGGLVGYLKDQGMGDEVAAQYEARLVAGGSILALQVPTGDLDEKIAESLLVKYDAAGVFTAYPTTTTDAAPVVPRAVPSEPLEHGAIAPENAQPVEVPAAAVTPTRSDPVSGLAVEGYVEDPVTGVRRPVFFEAGRAYYAA